MHILPQVYTTEEALVIVMEYASLGPLEERLATTGTLSESVSKKLFRQLVDGLLYCHDQVWQHLLYLPHNAIAQNDCQSNSVLTAVFSYIEGVTRLAMTAS